MKHTVTRSIVIVCLFAAVTPMLAAPMIAPIVVDPNPVKVINPSPGSSICNGVVCVPVRK
jgi:hypothetical protein